MLPLTQTEVEKLLYTEHNLTRPATQDDVNLMKQSLNRLVEKYYKDGLDDKVFECIEIKKSVNVKNLSVVEDEESWIFSFPIKVRNEALLDTGYLILQKA
ncbi:hypothetical protein GCM10007425_07490 [Lysinibacillus alkalisoli]|uniref:Uncharacterized protein n=1 Tax=Lysinibacillus alkalisoli TaxID=1911548 RepID=A0A917FZR8_9BACI|nr:hypothetical protein [Lysinibacillus alkalisoli]GGG15672.1 hypothetical protein GCM10007425_07490 [Lysinibacillus alkalisoli]